MLKLTTLLCGTMFLAMLIGGRDDGQARYGLEGKIPPLRLAVEQHEQVPADIEVAATEPAKPVRVATAQPKPKPASLATLTDGQQATPAVYDASYQGGTEDALSGSMPLSMPLVQPSGETVMTDDSAASDVDGGDQGIIAYVSGTSVNVRSGPSADTDSVARLDRGEAVLILPSDTPGWSMIRIEGDGVSGYIATRFLSQTTASESGPSGD